jgi:nitrogen fixation/metabolism regulation signal transduction histidine kinase
VRRGNLRHRVTVRAEDELALLVTGFNQMTEALESSGIELDRRRRFTEAILESIPTGVISIGSDGSIQHVNRALAKIFPGGQTAKATRLEDLFSREDTTEIRYLMKRARRARRRGNWSCAPTAVRFTFAVTVSALNRN